MINVLFNVFCPNSGFIATNQNSINHLLQGGMLMLRNPPITPLLGGLLPPIALQEEVPRTPAGGHAAPHSPPTITFIGYSYDVDLITEIIRQANVTNITCNIDITNDYQAVKSKCGVINRYLSHYQLSGQWLFYLEYDITVDGLPEKLSQIIQSEFPPNVALVALNHNAHQMTVYEQVTTRDPVIYGQPVNNNGLVIGTGCWLLDLDRAVLPKLGLINCPTYGYGPDDEHIYQWLKAGGLEQAVATNIWANHNELNDKDFKRWKISVLTRQKPLDQHEYHQFWNKT